MINDFIYYVIHPGEKVWRTPSVRELRGFTTVDLNPGDAQTVSFTLTRDDFAFVGRANQPTVEPGRVDVMIDEHTRSIRVE